MFHQIFIVVNICSFGMSLGIWSIFYLVNIYQAVFGEESLLAVCFGMSLVIWSIFYLVNIYWAVIGAEAFWQWYVYGDLVNILFGQYLPGRFLSRGILATGPFLEPR